MKLTGRNAKLAALIAGILVVLVLIALAFTSCKKEEEAPPAVPWLWNGTLPAGISAAHVCSQDGPYLFGTYDGLLRKVDGAGGVLWDFGESQTVVTLLDSDSAGAVVLAAIEPTSSATAEIPNRLRVIGENGALRWGVDGPVAGAQVGGSVSADGAKVLVYTAAAKGMPALVSVRDSVAGAVRWAKQTEDAQRVAAQANIGFGIVVVGYEIQAADEKKPDGLVEAYESDSIRTHKQFNNVPTMPSLVTTTTAFFADSKGRLSAYEIADDGLGDRLWRKSVGTADAVVPAGDRFLVASYDTKGKGEKAEVTTTVGIYSQEGKRLFEEEWKAPSRYTPSLSPDGKHLALVPTSPGEGALTLIVHLDEKPVEVALSEGVSIVEFGCGPGKMLVGMYDGTYGIAAIPDPPEEE
ncbi:MAG: hypothetical protein EG823_03965 [Actinobacteria bacterium]|nr:hypothetical protein [Actinomycetota bacterium]